MNGQRTREAALEFQEYLAQKGLMAPATARARKAALSKVLGILSDDEAEDVTRLDVDDLMRRFSNLQGKDYTPDSLMTYKSRVKSALSDFDAYLENPLSFRPSLAQRDRKPKPERSVKPAAKARVETPLEHQSSSKVVSPSFAESSILPIPLRADLTVRIQGIPFDLTRAEAQKISNVILALAPGTT